MFSATTDAIWNCLVPIEHEGSTKKEGLQNNKQAAIAHRISAGTNVLYHQLRIRLVACLKTSRVYLKCERYPPLTYICHVDANTTMEYN